MTVINSVEKEVRDMVLLFKKEFFEKFGVYPDVYYNLLADESESRKLVSLKSLEELVNETYDTMFPGHCHNGGIRTKHRKREIVLFRQIFFVIGLDLGFGPSYLGCFLNFDHATVIHSRKAIKNLLDSNDKDTITYYTSVKNAFKKRFSYDGNVLQNSGSGLDAE